MVVALHDVHVELAFGWCEKDTLVDLELFTPASRIALRADEPSKRTFSTLLPKSSRRVAEMRVFFPAPEGP